MFKMTKGIYEELTESDRNYKVTKREGEKASSVELKYQLENGGVYKIRFVSTDDDNDVAIRVYNVVSIKPEQVDKMLPVINELNLRYRYVKFVIDDDLEVSVSYDYPLTSVNPAKSAEEMLYRFVNIIDEAYPILMKVLWG